MAEQNKKGKKGGQGEENKTPTKKSIPENNAPQDELFEDIFQHIDVDEIKTDTTTKTASAKKKNSTQKPTKKKSSTPKKETGKKVASTRKKPTTPKSTTKAKKKTSTIKKETSEDKKETTKEIDKKEIKKETGTVKKDPEVKKPQKPLANKKLDIEDISAYIASTKAKQSNEDKEPLAKDGSKLQDIPHIYAVVPHVKGDHKVVFLREDAPKDLVDDGKKRTKGSEYIKKGMKIYDVHVDFKEHATLRSSNGEALDIRIIDDEEDLAKQLAAIQSGKGGGTNFGAPLIFATPKDKTLKKEKVKKEITKEKDETTNDINLPEKKEKVEQKVEKETKVIKTDPLEEKQVDAATKDKDVPKDTSTSSPEAEKKPWETVTEGKKEEEKKPWEDAVEEKVIEDVKPRADKVEKEDKEEVKPRDTKVEEITKKEEKKPRDAGEKDTTPTKESPPVTKEKEEKESKKVTKDTKDTKEVKTTPPEIIVEQTPKTTKEKVSGEKIATGSKEIKGETLDTSKDTKETPKKPIKEVPFSNAVENMHTHDAKKKIPSPINLDDLMVTPKQETVIPEKTPDKKEDLPNNKQEPQTIKDTPKSTPPQPEKIPKEPVKTVSDKKAKIDTPPEKAPTTGDTHFNIDTMLTATAKAAPETKPQEEPKGEQTPKVTEKPKEHTNANLDNLIGDGGTKYPTQQVTKDLVQPKHAIYAEHDSHDDGDEDETPPKSIKQKIRILFVIFMSLAILGGIIWVIRMAFFSNTNDTTQPDEQIGREIIDDGNDEDNKVPQVIPEDEAFGNPTKPDTTPPVLPEQELPETEPVDETFTIPELSAKLEAQQREAQRLVKDAKFIGSKKAIMFATTAAVKANSLLSDIEDNTISADEVQEGAEKIDFYLQEANKLLQ